MTRQSRDTVVAATDPALFETGSDLREAAKQSEALERLKRPWAFESGELKLRLTVPAGWVRWPVTEADGTTPARQTAQFTQLWDPETRRTPRGAAMVSIDCSPLDDTRRDDPAGALEAAARRYVAAAQEAGFATGGEPPVAARVGGREARRFELSLAGKRQPGVFRQVAYVTVVRGRVCVFAGTASDERAAAFRPVFDRMVESVSWIE